MVRSGAVVGSAVRTIRPSAWLPFERCMVPLHGEPYQSVPRPRMGRGTRADNRVAQVLWTWRIVKPFQRDRYSADNRGDYGCPMQPRIPGPGTTPPMQDSCAPTSSHDTANPVRAESSEPVSVVLTVRDDAAGLETALASLARQQRQPDEIVVVDGGSVPSQLGRTYRLVEEHPRARLITGHPCTIAEGRNRAIGAARYDLIACIDAGCTAQPDWLAKLIEPFANPEVEVVGGGYAIDPRTRLERVVGLLTMPGALQPVDPLRFNPSARSLAFRRRVWERAEGFPNWLYTAEDTLFDLKLRSLDPAPRYVLRRDAVVRWRPRSGWRAIYRQFKLYAQGEARIGRGRADHSYTTRRFVATGALFATTLLAFAMGSAGVGVLGLLLTLTLLGRTHHRKARRIARKTGFVVDYVLTLLAGEWVALASWKGWRLGRADRETEPRTYVHKLRQYFGSDAADVCVPPWNLADPPPPSTLVVSWHWPPVSRASANVLGTLFQAADPTAFRVLTREMPAPFDAEPAPCPPLPTEHLRWPLPDDEPVRFWTYFANVRMLVRMWWRASRLDAAQAVQRVITVYPHRFGLLTGWLISRWLDVPLFAYMHDFCFETLVTRSRLRRWFWQLVDRQVLRDAALIMVPTPAFVEHYRRRGLTHTWVLPHCVPPEITPAPERSADGTLRLVYAGNIYEAHDDAVAAFIGATRRVEQLEVEFLSRSHPVLHGQAQRWLPRAQALDCMRQADVGVVALGWNTPYPEEIRCCFPSKIVDYLALGLPIFAVVPAGCFVDRLIRTTGCGVVVNSLERGAIAVALEELRDPARRVQYRAACLLLTSELNPAYWMAELSLRLSHAPSPVRPSRSFPPARRSTSEMSGQAPAVCAEPAVVSVR